MFWTLPKPLTWLAIRTLCINFAGMVSVARYSDALNQHFNMSLLWCRPRHSLPFRPRPYASARVVLCSLLLLLASGDVDPNLGPSHAVRMLHVGTYNICSAPGKIGSIHDILSELSAGLWRLQQIRRLSCVTLCRTDTVLFTCTEVR